MPFTKCKKKTINAEKLNKSMTWLSNAHHVGGVNKVQLYTEPVVKDHVGDFQHIAPVLAPNFTRGQLGAALGVVLPYTLQAPMELNLKIICIQLPYLTCKLHSRKQHSSTAVQMLFGQEKKQKLKK